MGKGIREIGREKWEACSPAKKVIIPATVMTAASGGEYQPKALTRNWRAVAYRQNAAIRSIVLGWLFLQQQCG